MYDLSFLPDQEQNDIKEKLEVKTDLLASFLHFTKVIYKLRTGREFILSEPIGRESHFITIAKALTRFFYQENEKPFLRIHVPPRYGKSELIINFIAWTMAHYPDCNNLYVSHAANLAIKHTGIIRNILMMPYYRKLFDVYINDSSSAKNDFETTEGGSVYACGAGGSIVGRGAGITGVLNRFTGAIYIDDIIKPADATSDVIREGRNEWYYTELKSRLNNGNRTPIIFIGQITHENDLSGFLAEKEPDLWETIILPGLDDNKNALYPAKHSRADLLQMEELNPYIFAAQYQQKPQPAGGGLFKPEWFYLTDEEPDIKVAFITADTAETDKDYNDKTVFSFFGLYQIKHGEDLTDMIGLHWIDCVELQVEPAYLENEFKTFYAKCCRYKKRPSLIAIEKKSTGVTLLSTLKLYQGLRIMDIERTKESGNKTTRFLEMQQPIASGLVSLPKNGSHTQMCKEHMKKITANDTHRFDDIADTLYDGVKLGLIDKILINQSFNEEQFKQKDIAMDIMKSYNSLQSMKRARKW